jgi:hypothetical protein
MMIIHSISIGNFKLLLHNGSDTWLFNFNFAFLNLCSCMQVNRVRTKGGRYAAFARRFGEHLKGRSRDDEDDDSSDSDVAPEAGVQRRKNGSMSSRRKDQKHGIASDSQFRDDLPDDDEVEVGSPLTATSALQQQKQRERRLKEREARRRAAADAEAEELEFRFQERFSVSDRVSSRVNSHAHLSKKQ